MATQVAVRQKATMRPQLGLCFFAFILIGANDGAWGVVLPSIEAHYGIDKGTAANLLLAATAGYFIAAFNTGLLLQRLGRRNSLMLGTVVFGAGAALFATMPPFVALFVALLGIGFGGAIIDAGLNAFVAGLNGSTTFLNYLHAFYGVGALIGPLIASGILALALGWNTTYILWVVVAAVAMVGFGLLFDSAGAESAAVAKKEGNVLSAALRLRVVWIAAFFLLFYVGTEVSLGTWTYSLLTEDRHEIALLSGWIVSGYWLGLTVGRVVLGKYGVRFGEARMIEGCLAGVVVGVVLVWVAPVSAVAALGLWVTGFSLGPIFPTTIALIAKMVPERVQQSAIGFAASLGSAGAAFFPWLAGNLAQNFGLWTLLPYVVVLTIGMLVLWLMLQAGQRRVIASR